MEIPTFNEVETPEVATSCKHIILLYCKTDRWLVNPPGLSVRDCVITTAR